jgi:aspartyl-tRNA(Asn)/glutamyl-tRNA(Gln) amidotransferase subunit B
MLRLIEDGTISGKMAKDVVEEMYRTGKTPKTVIEEKGLVQITDEGAVAEAIRKVIAANPAQLAQYRSGKDKVFGFFVGQVMKATQGKANPQLVNDLLKKMLAG